MKNIIFTGALLLASSMTNQALANCSKASQVTDPELTTLLSGNTVCVQKSGGGWDAQEQHWSSHALWDYKLGPTDKVDPTKRLGVWFIVEDEVYYNYTTFGPPTAAPGPYTVHKNGSTKYDFCTLGGIVQATATVKSGVVGGCP